MRFLFAIGLLLTLDSFMYLLIIPPAMTLLAPRLALYTREAMQETLGKAISAPDPSAPGFELGFIVDDVDAVYADFVERGADSAVAPTDREWGQRTAYLRDPDGHLVEIMQTIAKPD